MMKGGGADDGGGDGDETFLYNLPSFTIRGIRLSVFLFLFLSPRWDPGEGLSLCSSRPSRAPVRSNCDIEDVENWDF